MTAGDPQLAICHVLHVEGHRFRSIATGTPAKLLLLLQMRQYVLGARAKGDQVVRKN